MTAEVGTTGTEFDMAVERGKVKEFATAMQCDDPAYHGSDAIVPPTFLISSVLWAPDGGRINVGFDRKRLLHGEQEFVFHGPPPSAGRALRVRERLTERFSKAGKRGGSMNFAVVVTEFRDEQDNLVAEARATYIEREARA